MKIYLVGGAVRDQLLGIAPQDRDWVVVGATPEEMIARGFRPVGKDFPVFLHPETNEEYALARTERKTAPGYHGFQFHASPDVTLEDDLRRRDLTINAMAMDEEGRLIDPYGGQEDLRLGRLRHVSEAFAEDPVRILRVARYAARYGRWGFHVAHDTHRLMRQMVENGEVDALVPERVWQEMERALGEPTPSRFIEVLRACGALARVLPEVDRLFGVPQPKQWHPEEDTGVHVLLVLDQAARLTPDTRVRFAALVHDLGKGTTPAAEWPRHVAHEDRGVELVERLCARLRVPNEHRDLALLVTRWHGHYHRAEEMRAATLLKTLEALDVFRRPERLDQYLLACEADARGRPGFEDAERPETALLRRAHAAACSVGAQEVIAAGFTGAAIKDELHRRRVRAIQTALGRTDEEREP
ncbi:MAG: multifunctional CCA addition/repair protein [Thiohalomonadaceae bacterium]